MATLTKPMKTGILILTLAALAIGVLYAWGYSAQSGVQAELNVYKTHFVQTLGVPDIGIQIRTTDEGKTTFLATATVSPEIFDNPVQRDAMIARILEASRTLPLKRDVDFFQGGVTTTKWGLANAFFNGDPVARTRP